MNFKEFFENNKIYYNVNSKITLVNKDFGVLNRDVFDNIYNNLERNASSSGHCAQLVRTSLGNYDVNKYCCILVEKNKIFDMEFFLRFSDKIKKEFDCENEYEIIFPSEEETTECKSFFIIKFKKNRKLNSYFYLFIYTLLRFFWYSENTLRGIAFYKYNEEFFNKLDFGLVLSFLNSMFFYSVNSDTFTLKVQYYTKPILLNKLIKLKKEGYINTYFEVEDSLSIRNKCLMNLIYSIGETKNISNLKSLPDLFNFYCSSLNNYEDYNSLKNLKEDSTIKCIEGFNPFLTNRVEYVVKELDLDNYLIKILDDTSVERYFKLSRFETNLVKPILQNQDLLTKFLNNLCVD